MKGGCAVCGKHGRIGDGKKDILKIDKDSKVVRVVCRGTHTPVQPREREQYGWR